VKLIILCFCPLFQILLDVKQLFMSQSSLVNITISENSKFTVCGDIHGQFYDLMNIFELNGLPSPSNPYVSFPCCDYGGYGAHAWVRL
jgi:hypothetical protein